MKIDKHSPLPKARVRLMHLAAALLSVGGLGFFNTGCVPTGPVVVSPTPYFYPANGTTLTTTPANITVLNIGNVPVCFTTDGRIFLFAM